VIRRDKSSHLAQVFDQCQGPLLLGSGRTHAYGFIEIEIEIGNEIEFPCLFDFDGDPDFDFG
jgi:hypothetical protein